MSDAETLRRLALALPGTSEHPHMDRRAFRARTIFATLAADGLTANLKFPPEHQAFKAMLAPEIYRPVSGGWGAQGWTTILLARADEAELADALAVAYRIAAGPKPKRARTR